MDEKVAKVYGNKVRVRACGICWQGDELLMVNHAGITNSNFWAPPGGGVEFGQSVEETLQKEFNEETGLTIATGNFMFGCEYIEAPIHSIELFYSVSPVSGKVKTGKDPEIQIIRDVKYLTIDYLKRISSEQVHGIFSRIHSADDLRGLKGFFRI